MKTRFNQILLFALFSLFLLAGNVNAEGTERTNVSSLEMINEPALVLQNWMVTENYWETSGLSSYQFEEAMNLEDWMINAPFFSEETMNKVESELEMESWMIDANFWDLK